MNAIAYPARATTAATPHAGTATITRRSLDKLEEDIISLSQHINATEYEFLVLLREFDLRQGWKAYHFNNCAEWLNMKCGMSPRTAREKLRVANALFDLPEISLALQKGDLSYSKARALTRVATPGTERDLLHFASRALHRGPPPPMWTTTATSCAMRNARLQRPMRIGRMMAAFSAMYRM